MHIDGNIAITNDSAADYAVLTSVGGGLEK